MFFFLKGPGQSSERLAGIHKYIWPLEVFHRTTFIICFSIPYKLAYIGHIDLKVGVPIENLTVKLVQAIRVMVAFLAALISRCFYSKKESNKVTGIYILICVLYLKIAYALIRPERIIYNIFLRPQFHSFSATRKI